MALKDVVQSTRFRLFAVGAIAGGALSFATPASAWYSQVAGQACYPPNPDSLDGSDVNARSYFCNYVSTSDHPPSAVTSVEVDMKVNEPMTGAALCAYAVDYAGCAPQWATKTDGTLSTLMFTGDYLTPWTGADNRYTYAQVILGSTRDAFLGLKVTAN